jgi:hypothetical protein
MKSSLISVLLVVLAGTAYGEEMHHVVRGIDGLVKVPMSFTNAGPATMACNASLEHWYSLELGKASKDARVAVDVWADPRNGEVFLLNDKQDRMPIKSLWCGLEGRSWETRASITFERRAGSVPPAENMVCTQAENRVQCKAG